jgi:4-hydroxybenzoate polyprenyltransferase/phosphoserine phosphatase
MDAKIDTRAMPLAVDLDGTLIAGDLLWESLFALIKQRPLAVFLIVIWLLRGGRARLKSEIAARVSIDPSLLAYRSDVLAWLREERAKGRNIILATASHQKYGNAIAAHLGLFDGVIASSGAVNLKSAAKRDALVQRFGEAGFDYVGNSRDDIAVFEAARAGIVVAPDRAAACWAVEHNALVFRDEPLTLKTVAKMLRVHQWLKNGLIAVPLVLAHEINVLPQILAVFLAMIAFSATASAIYILNDIFDLAADRAHRSKRRRPFASGQVSIPTGIKTMTFLLAIAAVTCLFLPPLFGGVLAVYLVATTAYSMAVKRMLLFDIFMLAGLYTMRLVAGAAATGIEASFWLLAFSGFFFLSLALVKRYVELTTSVTAVGERVAGRGYRPEDAAIIMQAGVASAFAATLVLALYIDSIAVRELYAHPWMIWPLAPVVLYINLRVWVLAMRKEMDEDPVVFIASDWRSQIMVALSAMLLLFASTF